MIFSKSNFRLGILFILVLNLFSCIIAPNQFSQLPPGEWRGILKLDPSNWDKAKVHGRDVNPNVIIDEATLGELPFNFTVRYIDQDSFYIVLRNAGDTVIADKIEFGWDKSIAKDTIRIYFDTYDAYITGIFEERLIQGEYVVNTRENYRIPFVAHYGKDYRFSELRKQPFMDITGQWKTTFAAGEEAYHAIGEFRQSGNRLTGTFLTEKGDYRFLEGDIQADKIYLSAFDGGQTTLFEGKILPDSTIIGSFWNGIHFKTSWTAERNSDFQLTDPTSITHLLPGYTHLDFSFSDTDGNTITLNDERFQGKAKVIQINGTWCPNCKDETNFLAEFYKTKPDNLEIIGVSFEKYTDTLKAYKAIDHYVKKFGVPYPMLYGGINNAESFSKAFPMLSRINSYPTTVYLNKDNSVFKIYSGFSGPATSGYQQFINDFEKTIEEITVN